MVEDFRNFSTKMVPILKDTKFKAMSSESDSNVARVQGAGRESGITRGNLRLCGGADAPSLKVTVLTNPALP